MRFLLNRRKATQAAAYLLKLHGGEIDLLLLMKLLYLADRATLLEVGIPITGAQMTSMDWGPLLSEVYDETKPNRVGNEYWRTYISQRSGNQLSLISNALELDELSKYEIKVLDKIHGEFGVLDPLELSRFTHQLPEWIDPQGSSVPIDPVTILRAEGKTEDEIAELSQIAEEVYFLKLLQDPVSK